MRIIITCGPSYEPIDQARRLTNFSTGKLGAEMADFFSRAGHEVICLRGEGSTHPAPSQACTVIAFSTNEDLAQKLEALSKEGGADAVLHASALCDYRVEQVLDAAGEAISSPKFATRDGKLHLVLAPAKKVLPLLRGWFPQAKIAGWKYELAGTREDAFGKAWRQIREGGVNACVLNGAAYGAGFALCHADGAVTPCATSAELCEALRVWLKA